VPADHDHPQSFRVIGVQISHLSRRGQFAFLAGGVFFFLLIYGYLQVRSVHPYGMLLRVRLVYDV
jgi:hypothetical protein